jgi:hypothetical protein
MTKGFHAIATRIVNAEESFIAFAMQQASITRVEAVRALVAMQRAKVLKIDPVSGSFHVKHGAFLDAAVIRRAAQGAR